MVRARIGKGLFVILGAAAWVWLSATTAACQAEAPPSSSSADPIALNTNGLGAQQAGRMDEAFSDYQQSAAAGNPTGEQLLGWCYWNGWGVEKDYATAVEWFKKSAAQNESGGQYGIGCAYDYGMGETQDYTEAVKWYRKSAATGNAYGEYGLGESYFTGHGAAKDYAKALEWYQKSAAQGNAYGQYGLGQCYEYGAGVDKNLETARHWLQMAADQNNASAQSDLKNLGGTATGESGTQAATQGDAEAEYKEGTGNWFAMEMQGLADQTKHWDPDKCREYAAMIQKSADQNYPPGLNWMGIYYQNDPCGLGIKDEDRARSLFEKAAALGNTEAVTNLQKLNQASSPAAPQNQDSLSPEEALKRAKEADEKKDYKEAARMYEWSAKGGNAEGQYRMAANLFTTVIAGNIGGMWVTEGNDKEKWDKEVEDEREKGLDWLEKSAAQNYAPAELVLGKFYATKGGQLNEHFGLEQDMEKAKQWLGKAAKQGNGEAKEMLSDLNSGITPPYKGAFSDLDSQTTSEKTSSPNATGGSNLSSQKKNGNPAPAPEDPKAPGHADYQKGLDAQKAGHLKKALGFFKKSASLGNARAQAALGWLYCEGQGIKRDHYVPVQKWFKKAADQGDGSGECGMGLIYLSGLGVKSDYGMAVDWLQKSADHGDARGEYTLATCYQFGYGLAKDPDKTLYWLRLSVDQNYPGAQKLLDVLNSNSQKSKAAAAASSGDGGASLLQQGNDALKAGQNDQAFEDYQQSAEQGNAEGEGQLAIQYFNRGTDADYAKAYEWGSKSAAQGNLTGEYILGECYAGGHGVPLDDAKAVIWLQKSADQGYFQAEFEIGWRCQEGTGMPKDLAKAKYWYQLSANQGFAHAQLCLDNLKNATAASDTGAASSASQGDSSSTPTAEQAVQNGDYYMATDSGHFDEAKAIEWYTYAGNMGNAEAEYKLGDLYDSYCDGTLLTPPENTPYNCPKALYWFQLAANQGYKDAADKVNTYHQSGWR